MATKFKTKNTGDINNGAFGEVDWSPDRDVIIKKMMLIERSGTPGYNTQVYISISDIPYTLDFVPAAAIGNNPEYCWKPDLPVPKSAKIYVKILNNEGAVKNWDVVFEYE